MQRLTIIERTCGCPLFDRIWNWPKDDQRSPISTSKIIQLFYNFAKEVDKGEITRVIFDPTEEKPKKHKNKMRYNMSHQYQAKGSTNLSNQFIHNALNHKGETEMWCMRNDYVIVAMFISAHEYKENPRIQVNSLMSMFTNQFKQKFHALKETFALMGKDLEESCGELKYMGDFETFKSSLTGDVVTSSPTPVEAIFTSRSVADGNDIVLSTDIIGHSSVDESEDVEDEDEESEEEKDSIAIGAYSSFSSSTTPAVSNIWSK